MNIVIADCFDTWEHRVDLIYKVLKEEGHQVTCLLSDYRHIDKTRRTEKKRDTIFFTAEPYKKNISPARVHSHGQLSKDIFTWVEDHKSVIDILWVLAPPNSFIYDAARVKQKWPKMHLIIDIIDLWPETMPVGRLKYLPFFNVWRLLRDHNLRVANVVVTECNLFKEVLGRKSDGIKVETLYLARENRGYEPNLCLPNDKLALCYLGSINNIIDIAAIGQIIRECRKQNPVIFHIIGDGEKKKELLKVAEDSGAKVIDHGKIYNQEEKKGIFDSCHYGLNIMKPSVCVGLTMKSIDYFEFGLPIINNIKGDTWEAIEKYDCGVNLGKKKLHLSVEENSNQRLNSRHFFEKYLTLEIAKDKIHTILKDIR